MPDVNFSDPITCVILACDAMRAKLERCQPLKLSDRTELIEVLKLASETLDEYWSATCEVSIDELDEGRCTGCGEAGCDGECELR